MRQTHPNTVLPIAAESIITTLELDRIALSQTNKKQRSTRKKYNFSDFSSFVFQEPANAFKEKRIQTLRRNTCLLQLIVSYVGKTHSLGRGASHELLSVWISCDKPTLTHGFAHRSRVDYNNFGVGQNRFVANKQKTKEYEKKYYLSDFLFFRFPRAGLCVCRKTSSKITKGHLFASIDCELNEKNTFTAQRLFTWIVFSGRISCDKTTLTRFPPSQPSRL